MRKVRREHQHTGYRLLHPRCYVLNATLKLLGARSQHLAPIEQELRFGLREHNIGRQKLVKLHKFSRHNHPLGDDFCWDRRESRADHKWMMKNWRWISGERCRHTRLRGKGGNSTRSRGYKRRIWGRKRRYKDGTTKAGLPEEDKVNAKEDCSEKPVPEAGKADA